MKKFAIPAILVATVMVAGMFAFMPVEQASTVHTTNTITLAANSVTAAALAADAVTEIQTGIAELESLTLTDIDVTEGTDVYTLSCDGDAFVNSIYVQQLPANDGTTSDLTIAFGSTTSGAAGLQAAADADLAISAATFFEVTITATESLTMTTAGTADGDDGDLDIFATVTRNADVVCTLTETA